ncbi:hypothetical protein HAX54_021511, partial [Datura stramonium]|nr:hypothetical protein [Datura stramonium]
GLGPGPQRALLRDYNSNGGAPDSKNLGCNPATEVAVGAPKRAKGPGAQTSDGRSTTLRELSSNHHLPCVRQRGLAFRPAAGSGLTGGQYPSHDTTAARFLGAECGSDAMRSARGR